ncbi:MAG TPA: hypothetical protein VKU91_03050, partial [Acidimicrobiales bacterium]|nr:hypothetical protein [Acidimicrobiales bacterium]
MILLIVVLCVVFVALVMSSATLVVTGRRRGRERPSALGRPGSRPSSTTRPETTGPAATPRP